MSRHPSRPASEALTLTPIAYTRSCFRDKFGVPRQPGLTRHAWADLVIEPPFDREDAFRGLESASHLWLTFQFHEAVRAEWRPVVRPPRLGGNRKMGVFASRSPLRIRDHDLIDGTPILDIKPYLPFADSVPEATLGWADSAPVERLPVTFLPEADLQLAQLDRDNYPDLRALIEDVVSYDPRPSFRRGRDEDRIYGAHLYDLNVRFRFVRYAAETTGQASAREGVEVLSVC